MNRAEIMEIKKLYGIKQCAVTRIAGCYIDAEKNIIAKFNDLFLSKPEEEQFKYLDIFKKGLSGGAGKTIHSYHVKENGNIKGLQAIVASGLKESAAAAIDAMFEKIIEEYDVVENCLILLMHNTYDIPNRNEDKLKDGESEEVYSYITCYICPMVLEKAGLAYNKDSKHIEKKELRWCVDAPSFSFLYPSFEDRSADPSVVTVYTKNADNKYERIINNFLGCEGMPSVEEQKELFQQIVEKAVKEAAPEKSLAVVKKVNACLSEINNECNDGTLGKKEISDILRKSDVPQVEAEKFVESLTDHIPKIELAAVKGDMKIKMPGISMTVKSDILSRIERREINGKKYILIEEDETQPLIINGVAI